jgi:hypothetical protein
MYGDREEDIDGTQLAAEFTFSNLQKFGQEFLTKLRGKKMPNQLLKKVIDCNRYTCHLPSSSKIERSGEKP